MQIKALEYDCKKKKDVALLAHHYGITYWLMRLKYLLYETTSISQSVISLQDCQTSVFQLKIR
jgi:hypothetical protein